MHVLSLFIAILSGLVVLLGYFLPALAPLQSLLLNWAIILSGTAALVGIFNLIMVHGRKISRREKGGAYSAVLLLSLFVSFIFGLALKPDSTLMDWIVKAVILPVEASLMALLAITLLYAALRLLRRRPDRMSILFLLSAALMLLASATLPFGEMTPLSDFVRPWVQHVLSLGGTRGLLIGVALGTLTTALRVLFAADRPYGSKGL